VSPNHNPKYQVVLQRLRAARKAAGLTQAEAGRRIGQSQSFIWKVEANQLTLDPVELWEMARVYGLPVTHFLDFGEAREEQRKATDGDSGDPKDD
jgi:transcriptional regulator with XRE-family HTH domain